MAPKLLLLLVFFVGNVVPHPDLLLRIEQLTQILEKKPKAKQLYLQRGDLYRQHHQFVLAAKDYHKALQNGVDKNDVLLHQALLQRDKNKTLLAEKMLSQVSKQSHNKNTIFMALVNLAEMQQQQKNWLVAAQYYEKAIKIEPKSVSLYLAAVENYQKAGKSHNAKSITLLEQAINYNKGVIALYTTIIKLERSNKHKQRAEYWLAQLHKIYPNYSLPSNIK